MVNATQSGDPLTKRQSRVAKLIQQHWCENGYAPTVRWLSQELGFASPVGVICHLHALRKKGVIVWEPGVARTIRPTGDAT